MRAAFAAVLLLIVSSYANAQRCAGCGGPDTLPRTHVLPAWGVHLGEPQKASAALGVVLGEDWQSRGRDHSRNVALFAEPGIAAGRASIAYLDQGYGSFGSGFGIAASVLRTWDDPWVAKQNVTYAGADLLLWPVVFIGPRVGLFHSVTGPSGSRKWFVAFDFGVGL